MLTGTTGTACKYSKVFGTYKKTSIDLAHICMYWGEAWRSEIRDQSRVFFPALGICGTMFDIKVPRTAGNR